MVKTVKSVFLSHHTIGKVLSFVCSEVIGSLVIGSEVTIRAYNWFRGNYQGM